MTKAQPQTFIGSSSEGLVVAQAIRANLPKEANCRIWSEGIFVPGRTYIETLEKTLDEMDFAILVATPDDLLTKRDLAGFTMRDNVLFELGLFMAKLGRGRTYLVTCKDKPIHIPSDLLGLITVTYATLTGTADWTSVLAEPCRVIAQAMKEAEVEVSRSMKRAIVKRLLAWTTKLHGLIITLQAESFKSVLDREKFERIRSDIARRLGEMIQDHQRDAADIGALERYTALANAVLEAVDTVPFPAEALVSSGDLVGGALSHFLGGKSIDKQINQRVDSLSRRYDAWWQEYGPRISQSLLNLQMSLVAAI